MYVSNMMFGRPYQSYVPVPLFPSATKAQISWFRKWDRALAESCDVVGFAGGLSHAVVQSINKPDISNKLACVETAATQFLQWERIGLKQLKKINGAMLGIQEIDLRKTPVWISAPHPGLSWHVGSPPQLLENLMKKLLERPPREYPASMLAIVCLFRILQIHPFADGNGRTARFYAAWLIHSTIGSSVAFLEVLNTFWNQSRMDINAISLSSQLSKTLCPIFNSVKQIADID
jgi:hypothetical protein